jgi:hypothetical protein
MGRAQYGIIHELQDLVAADRDVEAARELRPRRYERRFEQS